MTLPTNVDRRDIAGKHVLATHGDPIGGEAAADGWRHWDPRRSKLAAMIERDLPFSMDGGETVLYLGAAAGTTVSHLADFAGPVYAVEFAARPMRDLVGVAANRPSIVPLLKDARRPTTYAHIVEPVEIIVQDVATRGQARVALENRRFLAEDGRLLLAVKARSEDVTADPDVIFERVLSTLSNGYELLETARLDPLHDDHLGVVATPD